MIKAIYLDFDGTTYSHKQNCIPTSAAKGLKMAQENGIKVMLATGRSPAELDMFDFSGIEFDGYVVNNGQEVFDRKQNLLYINPMKEKLLDTILRYFNEKKIPVMLSTERSLFINIHNDHVRHVLSESNTKLPPVKEYNNEDIVMAAIFLNDEETKKEVFKLSDVAELTWWNEGAIDIVPKGTSKAKGIYIMNDIIGIENSECIGIGDGENDIEMMKHCGISVAMGNSIDEVKEIADYVTTHIDEDGMWNALKHYNLI